ncbi:HpcH/HpaI aldolase/citrate lyase family protein [Hoeflea prorocentri]|uniref:CoA ester lyase n=1 Tax=Hoeflea prorocentri TaxID=1922333 RepID=A0A9X3UGZ5_9HYPH|nr:CoA ester lyase [Hoeflea prorocentri]MCY6380680.1 CoA ester lyase [Hoeflea prorocentri]MDA5398480.1 CoA ester lyase [Hoeflea prorocentri]
MRSYLFVPGDSERKLHKSLSSGADCLLIDLEDSVSLSQKSTARKMTRAFISEARESGAAPQPSLVVRINPLGSGLTEDDLAEIVSVGPDAVLLPKAEHGSDVQKLSSMIAVHEAEAGIDEGVTGIHALVTETARGTLNAGTYTSVSRRLRSLSWGGEDLSADVGVQTNRDKNGQYTDLFRYARTVTLLGAASAGVDAIDTVFTDFRDTEGLEQECRAAVRDGFSGKMAIHPAQVKIINRVFTPSQESLARARKIVSLFDEAGDDVGVLSLDGQMIDRPHLRQAQKILERARAAGLP